MSKPKKYYWLKLEKNFFKRHDIQIIESMENGKDYVLFYLKLILESINHEGKLRFNDLVPYNDKMLATITNTNVDIVRSAIKIFEQLGLMEIWEDQTIFIEDTQKMLGFETEWAKKKRDYKNRLQVDVTQEQLPNSYPYKLGKCEVLSQEQIRLPNGSVRYVDEKRYGGNGMIALAKADGKCRLCGDDEKVVIHHSNGYSNELEDLEVLCTKCHGKEHTKTSVGHDSEIVRQEIELEKELELEKDKEIDKEKKKKTTTKRFSKPSIDELQTYITDSKFNIDARHFFDYYESKGWLVGKSPMKDWKATVRNWNRRNEEVKPKPNNRTKVIKKAYDEIPPELKLDPEERQRMIAKLKGQPDKSEDD